MRSIMEPLDRGGWHIDTLYGGDRSLWGPINLQCGYAGFAGRSYFDVSFFRNAWSVMNGFQATCLDDASDPCDPVPPPEPWTPPPLPPLPPPEPPGVDEGEYSEPPPIPKYLPAPTRIYTGSGEETGGVGWSQWQLEEGSYVLSAEAVNLPGSGPTLVVVVWRETGVTVEHIPITIPASPKEGLPSSALYIADGADSISWSRWDFSGTVLSADTADIPGMGPSLVLVVSRPSGVCLEYLPLSAATERHDSP
jgi:hypothetical protein